MRAESPGSDSSSGLPRLPPGRHGLPREFVTQNQRDRLVAGMIATVAEHGYHEATVAQIIEAAGVSRRTFYSFFSTKEECFLDTYDRIAGHISEAMTTAAEATAAGWPETVRAQLAALLDVFSANPDLARYLFVASLGSEGAPAARYRLTTERLRALLAAGMPGPPTTREPSPAAEQAMVGSLGALMVQRLAADEDLDDLLPDLVEAALAPYLGRAEAAQVAAEPL